MKRKLTPAQAAKKLVTDLQEENTAYALTAVNLRQKLEEIEEAKSRKPVRSATIVVHDANGMLISEQIFVLHENDQLGFDIDSDGNVHCVAQTDTRK